MGDWAREVTGYGGLWHGVRKHRGEDGEGRSEPLCILLHKGLGTDSKEVAVIIPACQKSCLVDCDNEAEEEGYLGSWLGAVTCP